MPGVKGKSGRKKGCKSPNPSGKPKGAKNLVRGAIKESLDDLLTANFAKFQGTLETLSATDPDKFVKYYLEMLKLRLPKPADDAPAGGTLATLEAFRLRLFGNAWPENQEETPQPKK